MCRDPEIRSDEEAEYIEFLKAEAEANAEDFDAAVDSDDPTDEELEDMLSRFDKREQAEL